MFATRFALALGLFAASLPVQKAAAWELPRSEDFCNTGWVLKSLKTKVDSKYRQYNGTKLFLLDIINPTQTYERKRDATHKVKRKFCHATARMNDGSKRDMWYLLETPWGFAGTPKLAGLEFCIAGLDPWKIYGRDCSTIRNSIGY
jgi:hypothetical protein